MCSFSECRSKKSTSIPATPEDLLRLGSYEAKPDEWPAHGMETEVQRLLKGIERIMEFALAEPFAAPVDLNAYPQYCLSIEYPSDLSTIKARLENRFYRYVPLDFYDSFCFDVNGSLGFQTPQRIPF